MGQQNKIQLTDIQQRVIAAVELCYLKAEARLKRQFPRPNILFSLRGRSAGTAHLTENKIRFNNTLLIENEQAFIDQVVPHEICHLLCFILHGRTKPHGVEWQALMRGVYGLAAQTTHQFDVSSVTKSVLYQCNCGDISLSIRRHNNIMQNKTQYRCQRCKQQITQKQ